jgi:hypothetical protein
MPELPKIAEIEIHAYRGSMQIAADQARNE